MVDQKHGSPTGPDRHGPPVGRDEDQPPVAVAVGEPIKTALVARARSHVEAQPRPPLVPLRLVGCLEAGACWKVQSP